MARPTCSGTRARSARETATIVAKATGTVSSAGWASSGAAPAGSRAPTITDEDGGPRESAADQHAGHGAARGQAAPPDAEHEQGAEGRGGDREGELDRVGDREALRAGGEQQRATRGEDAADPEPGDACRSDG